LLINLKITKTACRGLWGYSKELHIGNSSAVPVNGVLSEWALSVGNNVADPEEANYIVLDSGIYLHLFFDE
jgi:hypothetical protein